LTLVLFCLLLVSYTSLKNMQISGLN